MNYIKLLKKTIMHFSVLYKLARKMKKLRDTNKYHKWFIDNQKLSITELEQQSRVNFAYQPLISIVVPVYDPPLVFLQEMLDSVIAQSYNNWELCIADGGSNDLVQTLLEVYVNKDNRVKIIFLKENLHICGNSNAAISLARGDYIGLLDHDDLLAPQCLFEYVKAINQHNCQVDVLYCDEDFYSNGKHLLAHFKPDFAPESLRETNYITHFLMFKTSLLLQISSPIFDSSFQGAQDYDLILRLVEKSQYVVHIPLVLYHWRMHHGSSLGNPDSKVYAFESGRKALGAHLKRIGVNATVLVREQMLGVYKVSYEINDQPLISILIPNKNHVNVLRNCIQSILEKSTYNNYEIIIIENNSSDDSVFSYYREITGKNIKIAYYPKSGFNYSSINNWGVQYANGEYLLFLNNDTQVINLDWMQELLQYAQQQEIGAVGAKLLFPDNTVQHAGIVITNNSLPGNLFDSVPKDYIAAFERCHRVQNLSAVTAACLMIQKSKFLEINGFDEGLVVAFNDVDLCLKLIQAGYRNIFNPDVLLYHYESKSRGYDDTFEKKQRWNLEYKYFQTKWGNSYDDKYYPNVYNNYNYTWK